MSIAVQQFIQIVRETWRATLFCEKCGCKTSHVGRESGREEIYTCAVCHCQKVYTVR